MTTWQVSVFDDATEALLAELPARQPDREEVRRQWHLPPSESIGSLLIEPVHLRFVNDLLSEPLRLVDGLSAFLEELADFPGERVDD